MKKLFALALALVMVFTLCACGAKEQPPTDTVETPVPTEVVETPAPTVAVETPDFSEELLEVYIKSIVENNDDVLTGYDINGKSVTMYSTNATADFIVMNLALDYGKPHPDWDNITTTLDSVSINILQGVSDLGIDGAEVSIQIVSPMDANVIYYITTNGTPVFNINELFTGAEVNGKSTTIYTSHEEADSIVEGLAANDEECHSKWKNLISTIDGISSSFSQSANAIVPDVTISVQLTSPVNSDTVYYISTNGAPVFNIADAEAAGASKPIDDIIFYPADTYKVGADLEPGEYYFIPAEADRQLYVVARTGGVNNDILESEFSSGPVYMTVEDGQYLEVSHAKFCLASDYPSQITNTISADGMYLVGKDIKPGEYKLTNTREAGDAYYFLYSDSGVNKSISASSGFEKSCYVTVQEGQYLSVMDCIGSLVN